MANKYPIREEHLEYYKFLEALRKSGETNMYGAPPYLESYFGISKIEAYAIFAEWMDNYDKINELYDLRNRQKPLKIKTTTTIHFES